jgi:hypothetical protein
MTQTATAPPTAVKDDHGTEYVILVRDDTPGTQGRWDRIGPDVVTAEQAIRDLAAKRPPDKQTATFIAIPLRSWKPVKVTAQTVTTLKLEEAK